MFNTAQELHIGIDQGLQSIDSNRKGSIEPNEKDWVLNTVMIQEINNRLNEATNVKRQGFEDTFKRIDDLESIKVSTAEITDLPIFKYGTDAVYIPLPPDYHRLIESTARVNYFGTVGSSVVKFQEYEATGDNYKTMRSVVKLPDSTDNYSGFLIQLFTDITGSYGSETYTKTTIFDINAEGHYFSYLTGSPLDNYFKTGYTPIYGTFSDYKYQFIRLVMDSVNNSTTMKNYGIKVYWERFAETYEKDSFIFIMEMPLASINLATSGFPARFFLSPTGDEPNSSVSGNTDTYGGVSNYLKPKFEVSALYDTNFYTAAEAAAYYAANFADQPSRVVKSSELSRLKKHYYGKTNPESPLTIIRGGRLIAFHDDTFEFDRLDIEYYRKPRLISLVNNQGCEITSDSFKMELVDKTVQKLSARLQDPNYKNILQENVILE